MGCFGLGDRLALSSAQFHQQGVLRAAKVSGCMIVMLELNHAAGKAVRVSIMKCADIADDLGV